MTDRNLRVLLVLLAGIVGSTVTQAQTPAALIYDPGVGAISFAAGDLKAALQQNGYSVTDLPLGDPSTATQPVRIILTTSEVSVPGKPTIAGMTNQGYAIQRVVDGAATNWWVLGQDAPGAMYGGLELAEAVKLADGLAGVTNRQTNPYLANRGIKFNIPLDARSPSYSDDSSSAQANIAHMWETNFWTGFLDNMARHRLNLLSLWSLHPFPSLVRVPEYPNVALADVKQKSGALWDASLVGTGMYNSSWALTTLKTMTIEEKIAFWQWVMQYAKDRGIDLYMFTWNIFVYGTEPSGYGITDRSTNAITTDYFRKSVRTLFNTYPLLAGIGLTVGENMGGISSAAEEQWAWDTYGLGVADAMADAENPESPYHAPGRVIRLVHRAHQADLNQIISYFSPLPGSTNADSTLAFSFKYSQAHMHSSTKPQFIYQNNWFNTIPAGKKVFLTVRNDDMYYLRWGDPDFARAYMTNLPNLSKIAGFYMGPDGYTWGREYLSTEPETPRQLVIEKMWYSFSLYGRLAFEPTLPNNRFEAILAERFPEVTSSNLFQGWASVSKILPLLTRFYWGALDFQWYPEACWSSSGFKTVQSFIDPQWDPMQSSEDGDRPLLMSVKQYVNGDAANGRLNPEQVADLLQQHADTGLASVQALSPGGNKELRLTLGDIHAMGWLGRYYAEKVRGAVDLYRYQTNGLASDHANARMHLITASNHWSQYSARWSTQYVQQVLTRMGLTVVDIAGIQTKVNADIPAPLTPPGPTYTLTTLPSANGSISVSPGGGSYVTGTVVQVTAAGNLGYGFSSWGGALAGSTNNPATVVMDTNKTISANFVSAPTYTLTTSATNGSISLNPPGGVYNSNTLVTVTAIPNGGYAFSNWRGDLSGSVSSTNLTMNGNKSVTANFSALPPGNRNVLLVVGDTANMTSGSGDLAIRDHLQSKGYTVQAMNDETATAGSATGKALVLISSTVSSANITSKFRDVAVPVINWETFVQDDCGFTTDLSTDRGNVTNRTTLNITNPGHPLAGGLAAGTNTVATSAGDFSWGVPGGSPIIIARLTSGSTDPCIYAYEAGTPMYGGTNAPARRVHLFLQNNTFASANDDGQKLFDAAVSWAIGQAAVPPSWVQPPVLQGGQLRLEWVGGTLQTTTNVTGGWNDIPGAVSPHLQPTTNPAQFFRVKQ